ncbi:MAG TPA: hypothetical protein VNO79_00865 [Actinomycetota bacterium]|nr:hypothetical protein [Actinomycetota bacterium]
MSPIEIAAVPGLGDHVVLAAGRVLFVAASRERAERFLRNHLASRLRWRGEDEAADLVAGGELDPREAWGLLERWAGEDARGGGHDG